MQAEILILGSGTSMGVPTLGCSCAVCTSTDARNLRLRPSIAISWQPEEAAAKRLHRVLIDTGPDFRAQALNAKIDWIDAVLYTHGHADHILGLDDLRPLSFLHKPNDLPLYADAETAETLERVYTYTFSPASLYPTRARVALHRIADHATLSIAGAAFTRVPLEHGAIESSGYRFGNAAYLTDMKSIPASSLPLLEDLDVLILDALRPQPHPSHATLEESIGWVERIRPRKAYFTHIAHEVEHAATEAQLPAHIRLCYDGLRIPFEI